MRNYFPAEATRVSQAKRLAAGPETRAVSLELNSLSFQIGRKLPTIPKAVSKTILYRGNPNVSHHTVFLAHSHAHLLVHHQGWPLSYRWEAAGAVPLP